MCRGGLKSKRGIPTVISGRGCIAVVPVWIRSNTWKVILDKEESTKMESLVIEILNVVGNGSYQGFPKN